MIDQKLKQSLQRWENEGGLVDTLYGSQPFQGVRRNKTYRAWNEFNRDAPGPAFGPAKNVWIAPKLRVHRLA